jgi:hypothetical protein
MVWDQRVAGSNPATPTKEKAFPQSGRVFSLRGLQIYISNPNWQRSTVKNTTTLTCGDIQKSIK